MYKKFINALSMLNLLGQAIYSLALPIALGALAAFLLTEYASAPSWIWAILMTLGALMGLYSMVKYILTATAGMDRMKKQQIADEEQKRDKEERQARLRDAAKKSEDTND
ncbi:MAG: hypothetical protein IKJ25_05995 [Clostridia bacterium]|nr:hypothetical protein [Clostridia bacterium]MBR3876307.1 hypothetical protein [Clostridia bacterium]